MAAHTILEFCHGQPEKSFTTGAVIVQEGDPSDGSLLILVSGVAEVLKHGTVCIATVREPGSSIGEMALLVGRPFSATVRAATPVRCLCIPDGMAFLLANPPVLLAIAGLLAERLFAASAYLADVKRQYQDSGTSLAMLDEILESLILHPGESGAEPGSERAMDPNE